MALLRLFIGANDSAREAVDLLATMACDQAEALKLRPRMSHTEASIIAIGVLSWHRNSACRTCGGHGYLTVGGEIGESRSVIGDAPCQACNGTAKKEFDGLFSPTRVWLAQWLRAEIEREQAEAGAAAMRALAERMAQS